MLSKKPNKLLILFLIAISIINIIQGYTTELLADETYYWVYSNFLDWGYFDHPPMVAVWISISKLFFSSGEISVRFFSAITLSVTYYLIWLLIKHPKKTTYTWLFILIVLSTALFNVYGFITVPDAPLLFFMAIFLLGYQKYLDNKNFVSYIILAISIAGMMYSKYQAVLIVLFVLLSNLKLLTDYKLWITIIIAILLFSPHLYWQYNNDFASFRYHLYERSSRKYQIDFTTNHFLNLIAIIGFTFPIMYLAFYKNLKNSNKFQKALNYIVWGFAIFFFFSSFKNHVQAQWIVPISISLIIITFNYLVDNQKHIKTFKILAFITIGIIFILRIFMANDILPIQLEMHGNKKWIAKLDEKIADKQPIFINSYQDTSTYWFYSGKKPYQYNTFWSRKNQYDLLNYNKLIAIENVILVGINKNDIPTDSVEKKNKHYIFLKTLGSYNIDKNIRFSFKNSSVLLKKGENSIKVIVENPFNFDINTINFSVLLEDEKERRREVIKASYHNGFITFLYSNLQGNFNPTLIQIIGKVNKGIYPIRFSHKKECVLE